MHDYIALRIEPTPCDETITDLLAAFLADIDFETFEPDTKGLTSYIRKDLYNKEKVDEILKDFPIECKFKEEITIIEGEDWNKEWELNYFKPILIDDKLIIRSSFHTIQKDVPLEIIIDPKMAFGTGHHSTTAGMCRLIMDEDIKGKTVIDMGTGTGILSILCKKLGSAHTVGIDIDEFAIENAKENGILNNVEIEWEIGDDGKLDNKVPADIFLANINLNVIVDNLDKYVEKLKSEGKIFLSGFLDSDREKILKETAKYGLTLKKEISDNHWEALLLEKK